MKTALIAALAVIALGLAVSGEARAAFPGANGKIVFQTNRDGNAEIYTMNADGTNRVDLTRNPSEDVEPRWSPDGSRIVFASNRTGNYEIYTMAADGSGLNRLTFTSANNRRPSWTADGGILFHTDRDGNREIYRMNADGSGQSNLTRSSTDDAYAAAAPRGDKIAFTSDRAGDYHLYLLNPGSGLVRQVTDSVGGQDFEANWSPSGNDLVFVRFDTAFNTSDLYVVHANGGGLRQLTSTPDRIEFEPAWSPDGKKIVFHACSGLGTSSQHCANYVVNADGTGETELTKSPPIPFVDDFNSTALSDFWATQITGSGMTMQQVNGRLEITAGPDTTNDPNAGFAQAATFSKCNIAGDFDMQVDYSLLDWPSPDFVNVDFTEGNFVGGNWQSANGIFVSRWGTSTNFPPLQNVFVSGPPPTGALRLTRQGSTLTAWYLDGATWVPLQSRTIVADEVDATLDVFSNAPPFTHGPVKVAFDNFRITSGTMSCPTWWDDNAPDWQAVR